MKMHYAIDLTSKSLEILNYSADTLKHDMEYFGVSRPLELNTIERRVFSTLRAAQAFQASYKRAERGLKPIKGTRSEPGILLKRRYMILAALGLKNSTDRHYNKAWPPGMPFRFNDQTYCLEVSLIRIEEIEGSFRYHYKLR